MEIEIWKSDLNLKFEIRFKRTEIHFSIFIENRNWDLKLVFRFDNENKKRNKNQNSISF